MMLFVIIVNGFQPISIIAKCSILDVAAILDPPNLKKIKTVIFIYFYKEKIRSKYFLLIGKAFFTI